MSGLSIAFFGSSLLSAYWNGAATYYRGIIRALDRRGHRVHFFEPDAFERQQHRDLDPPSWAEVTVYPATDDGVLRALEQARGADLIVKASGVGVFDALLERLVLELRSATTLVGFWDVDAPATLDRLQNGSGDPFLPLIPRYDLIFTYGGGPLVRQRYLELGARTCVGIYNALDPETHHRVPEDPRFAGALGFLGNRLPDREARVDEFFLRAAAALPDKRFLLGGSGWQDKPLPANVSHLGHVFTRDHNAFNSTPLATLNINRSSMVNYGYSPATRVFEAAGAGACIISDAWEGIEHFLEPGVEILLADSGDEVVDQLRQLTPKRAAVIGHRARARMLAEHTYAHRALDVEAALGASPVRRARSGGQRKLEVVVLGLSITSSWGNGHATTYRSLLREFARRGHEVRFLERDRDWYAQHRDLPDPDFCEVALYRDLDELRELHSEAVRDADFVMLGSYVPEGVEVGEWVLASARGATGFYDIDTPVTLGKLARGDCDYLHPGMISRFDAYLSFTGGRTLTRLMREFGAPLALPLYCSVDRHLHQPSETEPRLDLGYMGTYSEDRQGALERLLLEPARQAPQRRFAVAGPQYPASITWPGNVERIDHLAPSDHPGFYGDSRFTLNLTRQDMIAAGHSPSVRMFEAAACGTPILSDFWPGLDEFFALGREILVVRSAAEVLDALRLPDGERHTIARRARQRALHEHSAERRAETLERYILHLLGTRTPGTRLP
ncbi:MAG: glycosyltransferase [Enhygromyxa sp.]